VPSPAARRAHAPVIQRRGDGAERGRILVLQWRACATHGAPPAREENRDAAAPAGHASSIVSIRPMSRPSPTQRARAAHDREARPVEVEGIDP
jgi:hypothetical protein